MFRNSFKIITVKYEKNLFSRTTLRRISYFV
jgi:hypothetical protein